MASRLAFGDALNVPKGGTLCFRERRSSRFKGTAIKRSATNHVEIWGSAPAGSIGTRRERNVLALAECSIVVAPYEIEGERAGTVGILGPTRMHYEQALAAVAVVSKRLGRVLSEGTGDR